MTGTGPSVHEAIKRFEHAQRRGGVPEGTIRARRHVLNRLLLAFPKRQFAGITELDLEEFLYGEPGILRDRAKQTGTSYRAHLNNFFLYGKRKGWRRDVLVAPKPHFRSRMPASNHAPTRLNEDALLLMLERVDHPMMRAMIAVGMSTALRISDIQKLKCGHVDLHTGELFVWVQKTGRYDAMPITLDLEEEIRRYLGWYTNQTGMTLKDEAYLFPGYTRGNYPVTGFLYRELDVSKHCSYSWAQTRLKSLFVECGIKVEPREAWHVIRRSVARIYFDRLRHDISHDHALRQTMALLGHANQTTTEKYLGLQAEREARNESLRGKRFISKDATVTPIRRVQ